jgi:hypothetical protein
MLTKSEHGESLPQKTGNGFVARMCTRDRLSLRLRDARIGVAALVSIVLGVLIDSGCCVVRWERDSAQQSADGCYFALCAGDTQCCLFSLLREIKGVRQC